MDSMVTVMLRGGLGNQMFEYAAGLNLALQQKKGLVLDTTYLNDRFPRPAFTYRTYDLDIFNLHPQFTSFSHISSTVPLPGLWLGLDLVFLAAKKAIGYPLVWQFSQGEKYFIKNSKAIRESFQFKYPLTGVAADIAVMIKESDSVSLHVRRGDYTLPKYKALYGDTDKAYYERAIAFIAGRVPDPHFFIFSDDITWCRENIKPSFPTVYIDDTSRGPKAAFHLELMSLCKYNIIANSSFSWWGAWLNANPQKIIIAPERWSVNKEESSDIVPSAWVRL